VRVRACVLWVYMRVRIGCMCVPIDRIPGETFQKHIHPQNIEFVHVLRIS
jgi:hypothetical protein